MISGFVADQEFLLQCGFVSDCSHFKAVSVLLLRQVPLNLIPTERPT
jgi:hypothetical protein